LLREIQSAGDIFFPQRWMDATLGGHNSRQAASIVRDSSGQTASATAVLGRFAGHRRSFPRQPHAGIPIAR
jgi:hypothetical protein